MTRPRLHLRHCVTSVLIAAAALTLAPAALGRVRRAHSRNVTAVLTYGGRFSQTRLTITRHGRRLYDARVRIPGCGTGCTAGGLGARVRGPVAVLSLGRGREPDVVLSAFTGGAHCCTEDQVLSLDRRSMTYVARTHDFGDPGAQLRRLRGRWSFVSADYRFAYRFISFAASGMPLQIWQFGGRRFLDVTRGFPILLQADAALWWGYFRADVRVGNGFIAAWAADEELLGNGSLVSATLRQQLREGHLRSTDPAVWPGGRHFIAALFGLLRQLRYIP